MSGHGIMRREVDRLESATSRLEKLVLPPEPVRFDQIAEYIRQLQEWARSAPEGSPRFWQIVATTHPGDDRPMLLVEAGYKPTKAHPKVLPLAIRLGSDPEEELARLLEQLGEHPNTL